MSHAHRGRQAFRPANAAVSHGWLSSLLIAALLSVWHLPPAQAACQSPLPTSVWHSLDDRIETDPAAVVDEVHRLLSATREDPLATAELRAIEASADDFLDDDDAVRRVVREGEAQLARVADGPARRAIAFRLELMQADAPEDRAAMVAGVRRLTFLEPTLTMASLDRVCLLIVRSSLNSELRRDDDSTADALRALDLAEIMRVPGAIAEASYQLAITYLGVGLYDDALQSARRAADYARSRNATASLSNALFIESHALENLERLPEALAVIEEVRTLNERLHQHVDVAFDDRHKCQLLLKLGRIDEAQGSCVQARKVLEANGRLDRVAVTDDSLAQIDLLRHHPERAVVRLDRILQHHVELVPPPSLPMLYRDRAQALLQLGRYQDASRDLVEAARLSDSQQIESRRLAATRIKERFGNDRVATEKRQLEAQITRERESAAMQARRSNLLLALAVAIGLLMASLAALLRMRVRYERNRRRSSETLEAQARVIATMAEPVLLANETGAIRYANASAERFFGMPSEDLQRRDIPDLGLPLIATADPVDGAPLSTPTTPCELQITGPAGERRSLMLTTAGVSLPDQSLTVYVLQDVTELRRLERQVLALLSQERALRSHEVHEGIAQDLTGLTLLVQSVAGRHESDQRTLREAITVLSQTIERARGLARGLAPVQLAGGSLDEALRRLAADATESFGIAVTVASDSGAHELLPVQTDLLYRIVSDYVRLTARDTDAHEVRVELGHGPDAVRISIRVRGGPADRNVGDAEPWATAEHLVRTLGGHVLVEDDGSDEWCIRLEVPHTPLEARTASVP